MVHGAWADSSSWGGQISALEAKGFRARAVANPLRNLLTDAASINYFLGSIDGPVVLVGHSYGGSVISEAAVASPNVKALVYIDAFLPDVGESAIALNGEGSALKQRPEEQLFDSIPYPDAPAGAADLLLKRDVFLQSFASDIAVEEADRLWATQRATSTAAVTTPNTAAAWKTIPSWAFISTGDQIITAASKQFMAQRAGAKVTTFSGGSHLSLISHPEAVVAVIESAATAVD
ncbi:alpha/beta hydrolase [Mycolicibacterium sp. BiH015]|uniref:alpha/beta hydrolase n=1 Tax=Mycolicibacterium sp. BiH015 TaxID=3018808 RepID=UPI0022E0EF11|nr:alpha/beta hydrolase [Mycolicibacterium sp. BiH015]